MLNGWALLIKKTHKEAEIERLRAGFEGCGCADCQELYPELELGRFGDRVKKNGGTIVIVAGKAGADLWSQYHQPNPWEAEVEQCQ
jgi:hypothetical protein